MHRIKRAVIEAQQRHIASGIVTPPENDTLIIRTETLAEAGQNKTYSYRLDGDGGDGDYFWSIIQGSLPVGLSLVLSGERGGTIEGTPTIVGTKVFTVQLQDSGGQTVSKAFSINVALPPNTTVSPRFLILNPAHLDLVYAKTSTATSGVMLTARNKAIGLNTVSLPLTRHVMVKAFTPPSGDKHDYWSLPLYWQPRIKNAYNDVTGKWYFNAALMDNTTFAQQHDGRGKWMGTIAQYFGHSELKRVLGLTDADLKDPKWNEVDYSRVGNFPLTLDYEDGDTSKPQNGEPYVHKDKFVNEESGKRAPESGWFRNMGRDTRRVALAYYFSGTATTPRNEAYAKKVKDILRVWFINPETRMNPNLNYAQCIPGHFEGKGGWTGIIDAEYLNRAMDAVNLIRGSVNWTLSEDQAFKAWLREFSDWMMQSRVWNTEMEGNILTSFELTYISIQLFIGEISKAYNRMKTVVVPLMKVQMVASGQFPKEYGRGDSWGYSTKILKMWFELAELCERIEPPVGQQKINLWTFVQGPYADPNNNPNRNVINPATGKVYGPDPNYINPGGQSVRKAFEYHYAAAKRGGAFGLSTSINTKWMDSVVQWASDVWRDAPTALWWTEWLRPRHNAWLAFNHYTTETTKDAAEGPFVRYRYWDTPAVT